MAGKPQVGVVTDSTADIPEALLQSLSIEMIPALLIIDGQTYEDGRQLSRATFYDGLPGYRQPPTTATPSPTLFEDAYQRFFDRGIKQVISIHVASRLSGMLNAVHQAANRYHDRVQVIDSGQLSLGLGFMVIEAAEAAQRGGSTSQVLEAVEHARERVRVAALINTLEYLRRSGRVSWLRAGFGNLLQIKALLTVRNGSIDELGKARTFGRALEELKAIGRSWGACTRLAILHTGIPSSAQQVANDLRDLSSSPPLIVEVTTIIGAHVGPGSIGLAGLTT